MTGRMGPSDRQLRTTSEAIDPEEIDPEKLARKRPIGRPSKLTPEVQARIVAHIEDGLFRRRAAALEGIDEGTISRWYARGQSADPSDAAESLYRDFYVSVNHAEASFMRGSVQQIKQTSVGNPKTLQWYLSRRFPGEFGRRDNVEEVDAGEQAEDAKQLREALLERLEKLIPEDAPLLPALEAGNGGS